MKLSTVRKKLMSELPIDFNKLQKLFLVTNKREINRRLKNSKLEGLLFKYLDITNLTHLSTEDLHSILFDKYRTKCSAAGCTKIAGYEQADKKFKEFCSKSCYNHSPENVTRREATLLKKYGVKNPFQAEEVKAKIRSTNLDRYGVENVSNNPKIKEKKTAKSLTKFGTKHPMQNKQVQENLRQSFLKKYGVDNPMLLDAVVDKVKQTCLDKYGVDNCRKSDSVKLKIVDSYIKTCLKKYGTSNAMHDPKVLSKWRSAVASKDTVTVAGKELQVQGYESLAISKIADTHKITAITTDPTSVGLIKYKHAGKSRIYLPDFKLKLSSGETVLVEVKSWFTLSNEDNVSKFKAALKSKHDFWLAIVEPALDSVRLIKNPNKNHLQALCETARMFSNDYRQIL